MAMSMFSSTTREMTLQVPNIVAPTNSVNSCLAFTLVTQRLSRPNTDQKSDWRVSKSLQIKTAFLLGYLALGNGKKMPGSGGGEHIDIRSLGHPRTAAQYSHLFSLGTVPPPATVTHWPMHVRAVSHQHLPLVQEPVLILVRCSEPDCPEGSQGSLSHSIHMERAATIYSL